MSESEQWERVKLWLRQNGAWIAVGVVIGVGGLMGWNAWQAHQNQLRAEASARYEELLGILSRRDTTRAYAEADAIRNQYGNTPYADQADLIAARSHVDEGDFGKAAVRLQRVIDKSKDRELAMVATTRLARIRIQEGRPDDALTLLDPAKAGSFAGRFEEIRGDALMAKGDKAAALAAYKAARNATLAGGADDDLLDLKIAELDGTAPAVSASGGPSPDPAAAGATTNGAT